MKIAKYEIEVDISTMQTFEGELPAPKGFWFEYDKRTKENDTIRGSESFNEWLWMDTEYRTTIMFGFRSLGVWIYITKYK